MEGFCIGGEGSASLQASMVRLYPRAADYREAGENLQVGVHLDPAIKTLQGFFLTKRDVLRVCDDVVSGMVEGLERHNANGSSMGTDYSLAMLDTFIPHPATGKESGTFFAADIGGTNVRACRITLDGAGHLGWSETRRSLTGFPIEDLVPLQSKNLIDMDECCPFEETSNLNDQSDTPKTSASLSPSFLRDKENEHQLFHKNSARSIPTPSSLARRQFTNRSAGVNNNQISLIGPEVPASRYFGAIGCLIHRLKYPGGSECGEFDDIDDCGKVGFTFSYPCKQSSLRESVLIHWVKGVQTGRRTREPMEGRDVGALFQKELHRLGLRIDVTAVVNDTAATLMCASYKYGRKTRVRMSVILGTGVNIAYIDPASHDYGYVGCIINTELGSFRNVPWNELDRQLDTQSGNPGSQILEKLVSGRYLGELVRLATCAAFSSTLALTDAARRIDSISSREAALLLPGQKFSLNRARIAFEQVWGLRFSDNQLYALQLIATCVFERSIQIAAATICATFKRTTIGLTDEHISAAIDGSLYSHNEWYSVRLNRYCQDMLAGMDIAGNTLNLRVVPDASLAGAAVVAAIAPDIK